MVSRLQAQRVCAASVLPLSFTAEYSSLIWARTPPAQWEVMPSWHQHETEVSVQIEQRSWEGRRGTYLVQNLTEHLRVWQNIRKNMDPARNTIIRTANSRLLRVTENLKKRLKWTQVQLKLRRKEQCRFLLTRAPQKGKGLLCLRNNSPVPLHQAISK